MDPQTYTVDAALEVPFHDTELFVKDGVRFLVTHSGGYAYSVAPEPQEGETLDWHVFIGLRRDDLILTLWSTDEDGYQRHETSAERYATLEEAMDLAVTEVVVKATLERTWS